MSANQPVNNEKDEKVVHEKHEETLEADSENEDEEEKETPVVLSPVQEAFLTSACRDSFWNVGRFEGSLARMIFKKDEKTREWVCARNRPMFDLFSASSEKHFPFLPLTSDVVSIIDRYIEYYTPSVDDEKNK